MKCHSLVPSGKAVAMLCGALLAAGILAKPGRADEWDKRTILTVKNEPIQIRDTVLQPGQYVLKLLDSPAERHVVQIFDRYQTHIINTIIAIPAERLQPTGNTQFTFWETPPGTAKAMRTWFYPGDNFGQEFPYPKHLLQLAKVEAPPPPPSPVPAPQPEAKAAPQPEQPTPAPAPEQPTQVAQNTPPPETPAHSTPEQPATLPKTSSPYPLIGLSGAILLGLFGLLRLKHAS